MSSYLHTHVDNVLPISQIFHSYLLAVLTFLFPFISLTTFQILEYHCTLFVDLRRKHMNPLYPQRTPLLNVSPKRFGSHTLKENPSTLHIAVASDLKSDVFIWGKSPVEKLQIYEKKSWNISFLKVHYAIGPRKVYSFITWHLILKIWINASAIGIFLKECT